MKKLDREQEVIKLAAGLQVDWQQNAVKNIIALCHGKISKWTKSKVKTIDELERLVCENVKLVFEEVWTDDDLKAVIKKYVQMGERIFATLTTDLDEGTFATLIERRQINGNSKDRYVAVIDCRGAKSYRRFFTKWHEIAHLLTIQGQLELPLHRSTSEKSPTERLMDVIAGEVGFYGPLFNPILRDEVAKDRELNLRTVERVRTRYSEAASFEATLRACVSRIGLPMLIAEMGLGYKSDEQRQLNSRQQTLFATPTPQAKLRVLSVSPNDLARGTALQMHRNMEVPRSSILHKFFSSSDPLNDEIEGMENLNIWRHSNGEAIGNIFVKIHARKTPNSMTVLVARV